MNYYVVLFAVAFSAAHVEANSPSTKQSFKQKRDRRALYKETANQVAGGATPPQARFVAKKILKREKEKQDSNKNFSHGENS